MEELKIGDTVKIISDDYLPGNDVKPPIHNGETYIIQDIYECKCGVRHLDLGLISQWSYISCHKCDERLLNGHAIHWCAPQRVELTHPQEEIEKPSTYDNR